MIENPTAFPCQEIRSGGFGIREASDGMSLRDWFATHAPEPTTERMATERGIDRGRNPHNDSYKPPLRSDDRIKAELAYRYADAMLAARKEPKPCSE